MLKKRTVLITGASSGIGQACARRFHTAGWHVVATMRSPEQFDWAPDSQNFSIAHLDVADPASIQSTLKDVIAQFGHIDVIVNNAGYSVAGPFEASTEQLVHRQFQTNVFGLMDVCREIIPHFRARNAGIIINIASVGGRVSFPLYSVYHASKWAVEGFTESLHYELQPFGIRVKLIEPGPIKTDFYARSQDWIVKPGLTAYDGFIDTVWPNMQKAGRNAPGPDIVAQAIYRAATDGSSRIRYSANSALILALRRLLPERLFYFLVRKALSRR